MTNDQKDEALVISWDKPQQAYVEKNRAWLPCAENFYWEMLEVVPPVYVGEWWGVGEPWKHTESGEPIYLFFRFTPLVCRMATEVEIRFEQKTLEFIGDIPRNLAEAAHNGTSMVPEKRGASVVQEYAQTLAVDWFNLSALIAKKPDLKATLDAEFARYREGYKGKTISWLYSKGRCISTFITGASNFPTRRAKKANDAEHNRLNELLEFRNRALEAIRRTLCPEKGPIMAGDSDAVERLEVKIKQAEELHAQMVKTNKAHAAFLKDPASLDESDLPEAIKQKIRTYKPAYTWEPHPFAPFQLQNSNANIKRMKDRLETIKAAKSTGDTTAEGSAARFEDCPSDNRVRLFFPGKPAEEVRARLKKNGFRWTPSLGCWQAYRNGYSLAFAKREAGLPEETAPAAAA